MGILDFLLDGNKKKPVVPPPTGAPAVATPLASQASSGEGSSVLSTILGAASGAAKGMSAKPVPIKPAAPVMKPKVENVHMDDALNLKGMIPEETLYSGNNEYIKEAAAQKYRELLHTEYATPEETGLPSWLQTPLQKAHQMTAAGAGYVGDTMQGALGLMGLSKTSKLMEAVQPEQQMRRIEDYLGKYDPAMLTELTSEKALTAYSPVANTAGQLEGAFAQGAVVSMGVGKVLTAIPAFNALRAGSYGVKGIYASHVLQNAASTLSIQATHGATRGADAATIARRVASSPSILLPFTSNAQVAIGGLADFFAGKTFMGMTNGQALTHAMLNAAGNTITRTSDAMGYGVSKEVATFNNDMGKIRTYFDGNLEKQGVPKVLRDEVLDSAQAIYAYRKGNPTDFDGVAKLYDQEGSRLQGVFKEYMRAQGMTGESRLLGLKGPTGDTGNPLQPGNPNVPQKPDMNALIKKYGSEDNIPLHELDNAEYQRVQQGGGLDTPDQNAVSALKEAQAKYEPLGDGTKEGFKAAVKLKTDPNAVTQIAASKQQWMQTPPEGPTVTRFVHFDELHDIVKNGAIIPEHHNIAATPGTVAWDTTPDYSAARDSGLFNGKPVWKITTSTANIGAADDIAFEVGRGLESSTKIPIDQLHIEGPGFEPSTALAPAATNPLTSIAPSIAGAPATVTPPTGLSSMLSGPKQSGSPEGTTQLQLPGLGEPPAQLPPDQVGKTLEQQLLRPQTAESSGNGGGDADSLDTIVRQYPTPVENKVHLLDYLATPEYVMNKIGLGAEMKQLRKGDESYRKELPIQLDRVAQWVERTKGEPDASKRIFQYLDGNKTVHLDSNEMGVAKEMKDWYVMWAKRMGIKPEGRITDYMPHIFDMQQQQEFDEDLAKLISDKVPKEVYNPFLKQRKGMPGFKEDAFLAAEVYAKRATRKVNLDPALNAISKASQGLEEKTYQYVKRYTQEVNLRPVETDVLTDNLIKSTLQNIGVDPYKFGARPTNTLLRSQRQMIYRGLIGGNVGSAIRNLTQGVNTYSELGEKYTTIGYTNLLKEVMSGRASQELKDNVVLGMDITQQDRVVSAQKKLLQAGDKALFSAFNTAEFINRGAAYYGAKAKYLSEGQAKGLKGDKLMEYAIDNAKAVVRKTQFQFGPIDAPLIMRGDLAKSALQLQGFTMKQAEFLTNKILVDKDVGGILRYTAASLVILATVGKALGLDGKDFMPGVRFMEDGSLPPGLQLPAGVAGAMLNLPDQYGRTSEDGTLQRVIGSPEVQRGAMMYIPGGAQIQKSTAGVGAFTAGEKRSKSGKTQTFPIEQDFDNFIRAITYGPYGTREGRDYIQKEIQGPGLLEKIFGTGDTGAGSTVPASKYSPSGSNFSVPKSRYTVPTR